MSLEDFMDGPSQTPEREGGKVLVDFSNVLFRAIYGSGEFKDSRQVQVPMIRHITFNMLGRYRKLFDKSKYPEIVLAFDGGKLWRNEIFPLYKANRRIKDPNESMQERELSEAIFNAFGAIRDELVSKSPFTCVKTLGAEADDVIGVLSKRFSADTDVVIVSGDKDMKQLIGKNVQLWSPGNPFKGDTGGYVKEVDPVQFLIDLIIDGDSGDGVPNMRSDDDVFYPVKKRQTSMMKKHREEYSSSIDKLGLPDKDATSFSDQETMTRYVRNRSMVDLNWIPDRIVDSVNISYDEDKPRVPRRKMTLYRYFSENNLNQHLQNIHNFV